MKKDPRIPTYLSAVQLFGCHVLHPSGACGSSRCSSLWGWLTSRLVFCRCLRVVAVLLPPSRRLTAPSPAARTPTLLQPPVMILLGWGEPLKHPPSLMLRHTYAVAAMVLIVRENGGGTGVEKGPPYPYLFICRSIVWLPRAASVWCLRVVAVLLPPSRRLTAPSPATRAPTLLRLPVMILLGRGGPLKPSALGG